MLKERLKKLFDHYDPAIQMVIAGVLSVEQEHISMQRPRVKEEIDALITRLVDQGSDLEGTPEDQE